MSDLASYKELLVSVEASKEMRAKIRRGLSDDPSTSGGEVIGIDIDPSTQDLVVAWQHDSGLKIHQITIKDITPREDS